MSYNDRKRLYSFLRNSKKDKKENLRKQIFLRNLAITLDKDLTERVETMCQPSRDTSPACPVLPNDEEKVWEPNMTYSYAKFEVVCCNNVRGSTCVLKPRPKHVN